MRAILLGAAALVAGALPSLADQAVSVGGGLALFNRPANPKAGVVLIPGGDGHLGVRPDGTFSKGANNQLVRTRKAYVGAGIATLTIDTGVDVAEAVKYMRSIAKSVAVVATSRGSLRVAPALKGKPDAVVLTSSMLDKVQGAIGSPAALPRTLVVHHRQDACRVTLPSLVGPFKAWGGGKVTVAWKSGGIDQGDACRAKSFHGFNGLDGDIVATISRFVLAGR